MKIFLVDDSRTVAAVMVPRLTSFGHDVSVLENGRLAFEKFCESPPDLILMDIEMPTMNGYEATKRIRAFEAAQQLAWTPVIFLTASDSAENMVMAIDAGGDDFLPKNLSENVLRAKMKALVRISEMRGQLQQAEKMATIGRLAAGVAHEINNPIGYVYSNLGTLEKYVQDTFCMLNLYEQTEPEIADAGVREKLMEARNKLDIAFLKEDLRALLEESREGITRVKTIVQNLKDFSHVDVNDEWHFTDLHNDIESTLNIVHNEIRNKADVVREYGELPEVECLSSQLNQVFMNLLVNAAHAIEKRGTITIRTGREGDEVWVEIADTGKGIPVENLKKIFDPFFTTKSIGKGTGLGLSLSYGIIQRHHGRIEVQSEMGIRTSFKVWLPVKHTDSPPPDPNGDSALLSGAREVSM